MKIIDKEFFPGWTRKAISFTIDDGNLRLDRKFLSIMKPKGFLGTFNLCSDRITAANKAEHLELYRGYEIHNHCKTHPYVLLPHIEYKYSDEPFDQNTANEELLYKTDIEGYYFIKMGNGWRKIATPELYKRFETEGLSELEEIFGKGKIRGYVWPYNMQKSPEIYEWLKSRNYDFIRRGGGESFDMPTDRTQWIFNAWHVNMVERSDKFENLADDGKLKIMILGVHSHDFENNNCWNLLIDFAERFGNAPEKYYYATVGDIFDYEDAKNALIVTDDAVINPTDIKLYIKIDGERVTLFPHSEVKL